MPRVWTWLGILALVAGAIGFADALGGPAPASAQGGATLSVPIPPASEQERVGSVRAQIGWDMAKQRWGWNMPVGKDIPVAQVEAPFRGGYIADTSHRHLPGTGFIPESGQTPTSAHATTVARHAFGPDSAGQGVKAVHAFAAGDWLGPGFLKTASSDPPTTDHPARVFNHAWIAPAQAATNDILRRVDYLVDTTDAIFVVGVDNRAGPAPAMLASAYNVISVGVASGRNTDGVTELETEGRAKPELVAPGNKTSWSCGVVTGVAAALLEIADREVQEAKEAELAEQEQPDAAPGTGNAEAEGEADTTNKATRNKDAARSEVIKAVLLAGAHHPAEWAPPEGEPLDRKLGAGVVDIDRSIVILEAGHAEPDQQTRQRYGWSFAAVGSARQRSYDFTIDQAQGESTFALTWHRRVRGGTTKVEDPITAQTTEVWNNAAFCPNLDLALVRIDDQGNEEQVALSTSTVDNVELIRVETLKPGRYALRVGRIEDEAEDAWDYALAWRIEAGE